MPEEPADTSNSEFSIHGTFWSLYLLGGLQTLAYAGFTILIVQLSLIMWPDEPYHALEIGILLTVLFWVSSLCGLFFGMLIDKFSRTKILFMISIFRGFSIAMLGFAEEGKGFETWLYFLFFIFIFALFAGGSWPSIASLSNDLVPKSHRSRFFGVMGLMMGLFMTFGFLVASFFVQYGFWREYFWGLGVLIVLAGFIFFIHMDEPKRGAQQIELMQILKHDDIKYDFQIDREMMKKTMFSKTNIVALVEGISSNILMGSAILLILPYIQTPPHNLSPIFTAVFMIVFGLTAGLIGQLAFGWLSDKVCKEHPIRRIYFIIFSLSFGMVSFVAIFFIPLPHFSVSEGQDIPYLFSLPIIWVMGMLFFTSNVIGSLFMVNQAPLIQEINLPEAQGKIVSWNQLVESIGWGLGAIIVGILLVMTGTNYQLTILMLLVFIIPGIMVWLFTLKWYPEDSKTVRNILNERAKILEARKNQIK
ncbi:MAG: MFS transporter [Promethearchaeota archaeon]